MGGLILKSTNQDLVRWEQMIKERTKSGMSVSEWCKTNEISKNRYYYWNHKINKTQSNFNKDSLAGLMKVLQQL